MFKRACAVGATAALLTLSACSADSTNPTAILVGDSQDSTASAVWGPSSSMNVLPIGRTTALAAPSRITRGRSVRWRSSNSSIIQVGSNGRAFAVGEGQAVITVSSSGGSASWTVFGLDAAAASLAVNSSLSRVPVGGESAVDLSLRTKTGVDLDASRASLSITNSTIAQVSSNRRITGIRPGETSLQVSVYSVTRTVPVQVVGTSLDPATPEVTSLSIAPQSVTVVAGAPVQFTASATWTAGGSGSPAVVYSAPVGTINSASGQYTAPATPGTYRVVVTLQGGTLADTATVTVAAPTVASFLLSPAAVTVPAGGAQQFNTTLSWADGQSHPSTTTYSATGGTITVGGLYSAGQLAGTFAVIATCSCGRADTSIVTVSAPQLTELSISPKTATVATGAIQQFSATAAWTTGATTLPAVTYSAPNGGTVNATTGAFTAPTTAGTYRVIVAHNGGTLRDTAMVTVTAPVAQLAALTISPKTVTLATGATQQFAATASWSTGATTLPPVTYSAPNGGSVNASTGMFTAPGTAGTYRVIVAHTGGTRRDTAMVTVTAPAAQLTALVISPATATVSAGGTLQFSATGTWSNGTSTAPVVTYGGLDGGTINATTGLFTAPTSAGSYRVVVAHTGGTLRDTAVVTVSPSGGGGTVTPSAFTPNLPTTAGLTKFMDTRFANMPLNGGLNADGIGFAWDGRNATDPTAPWGSNVLETYYDGNSAGNGEGGAVIYSSEDKRWRSIYFSISVWVPTNYVMHTGDEKFFYPYINTNGQITSGTIVGWTGPATGSEFGFNMQTQVGDGNVIPASNLAKVRKGVWQTIEMYAVMNTPGQRNGVWKVWVDGRVAADFSNVRYSAQASQSYFHGVRFDGTRGGGASSVLTPPGGQVRRYNRLVVYTAN